MLGENGPSLAAFIPVVGEERFFWASDFPEPPRPVYVGRRTCISGALPKSARAGLLHRCFYCCAIDLGNPVDDE